MTVTSHFSQLMLLPAAELDAARPDLEAALAALADRVLVPDDGGGGGLPKLRFDRLITELALVAPRFAFQLPPYFLNNARALATLEGMARSADPNFDVLQALHETVVETVLKQSVKDASPQFRRAAGLPLHAVTCRYMPSTCYRQRARRARHA